MRVLNYRIRINDNYLELSNDIDEALALYNLLFAAGRFVDVDGDDKNTTLDLWAVLDNRTVVPLREAFFGSS